VRKSGTPYRRKLRNFSNNTSQERIIKKPFNLKLKQMYGRGSNEKTKEKLGRVAPGLQIRTREATSLWGKMGHVLGETIVEEILI